MKTGVHSWLPQEVPLCKVEQSSKIKNNPDDLNLGRTALTYEKSEYQALVQLHFSLTPTGWEVTCSTLYLNIH